MTKKVLAIVIAVVAVIVAGVLIYNCSNSNTGDDSNNINSGSSGGKADSSGGGNTDSSGGTTHKHSFVLEQPEEEYLFSEATCTQKAWYYYSCECGAKGTDIFQYGTFGHSFTNYVSDNNATCTDDGTKTATCDRCDETNTITDEGTRLDHSFSKYVTNSNGYKEAECDHSCGKVAVIIEDGVTAIADKAFSNRSEIISVTIPNSVTSISKSAFEYCSGLTNVVIPDSVTTIGDRAFYICYELVSITLGSKVSYIGDKAFNDCNKLVEIINKSSLNLQKGSEENGGIAYNAINIKTGGTSDIINKNGFLFYTYDGNNCLLGYTGERTELILPEKFNGENYSIYNYAFYSYFSRKKLKNITIPNNVTAIGDYAFV